MAETDKAKVWYCILLG